MSLNYILPNGVTMQFGSEAEKNAFLSSQAGAGAQTQDSVGTQAQMEDIKQQRASSWYAPGGGFEQNYDGSPGQQSAMAQRQPATQPMSIGMGNPAATQTTSGYNAGNYAGAGLLAPQAGQQPGLMGAPAQPTMPMWEQTPQDYQAILDKYGIGRTPMVNGGINWMTPSINPGGISIYDAGQVRR